MRFLFCFICFNLSEGRADGQIGRNIDNIYPNDPIKELTRHDLNQIDLDEEPEDEIDIRYQKYRIFYFLKFLKLNYKTV